MKSNLGHMEAAAGIGGLIKTALVVRHRTVPSTLHYREPNPHIAFASGFHRCLGSHLARMELRVALEAFHERIPNYSIKPGVELEYSGNPRTPLNMPLVWG